MSFSAPRPQILKAADSLGKGKCEHLAGMFAQMAAFSSAEPVKGPQVPWKLGMLALWVAEYNKARKSRARTSALALAGRALVALAALAENSKDYVVFLGEKDVLRVCCLSPAVAARMLTAGARSLVLVSGTLSAAVGQELGVEFKHRLESVGSTSG